METTALEQQVLDTLKDIEKTRLKTIHLWQFDDGETVDGVTDDAYIVLKDEVWDVTVSFDSAKEFLTMDYDDIVESFYEAKKEQNSWTWGYDI